MGRILVVVRRCNMPRRRCIHEYVVDLACIQLRMFGRVEGVVDMDLPEVVLWVDGWVGIVRWVEGVWEVVRFVCD